MINSVLIGMNQLLPNTPSKTEVLEKIMPAFQEDLETLKPWIDSLKTDPITELEEYIATGKYTSKTTDIIFPILSNLLYVEIYVLSHNKESKCYEMVSDIFIYKPRNLRDDGNPPCVYVVKDNNHYDSLIIRKSKRNTRSMKGKVIDEEKDDELRRKTKKVGVSNEESIQCPTEDPNIITPLEELSKNTNDEQVLCICKKTYNYAEHECMLQCDKCDEWYHCSCVDYTCNGCIEVPAKDQNIESSPGENGIKKQLKDSKCQISKLEKELANKSKAASEVAIRANKLQSKNDKLQQEMSVLEDRCQTIKTTNIDLEDTVKRLNLLLSSYAAEMTAAEMSTDNRQMIETITKKCDALEKEKSEILERERLLEGENKVLKSQVSHEETLNYVVIDEYFSDDYDKDKDNATSSNQDENSDNPNIEMLLLKINELKETHEKLKGNVKKKCSEILNLKNEYSTQEGIAKSYAEENTRLKQLLDASQAESKRCQEIMDIMIERNKAATPVSFLDQESQKMDDVYSNYSDNVSACFVCSSFTYCRKT